MSHGDRARRAGRAAGFTLLELLIVVALIGIVTAMAVPRVLRARVAANESAAVASLRTINNGQAGYAAGAAEGGYAVSLTVLASPCPGANVGFISADMSADPTVKSGYTISVGPGSADPGPPDCHGTGSSLGYYATAAPISIGISGHRGFASSSRAAVFFDPTGAVPSEAAVLAGTALAVQ